VVLLPAVPPRSSPTLLGPLAASFLALVACGGAAPVEAPPAVPAPSSSVPPPVTEKPAPVERPASVAVWVHVEKPARLAALAQDVSDKPSAGASCAKGDLVDCLTFVDPARPVDLAGAPGDSGNDVMAVAFSVDSVAAFREHAGKTFDTSEPKPGLLRLAKKAAADTTSAHEDDQPVTCDLGDAESTHRVVCGNEAGFASIGPWLRTAPKPSSTDDVARVEVYPAPVVAAAEKALGGDASKHDELRQFAHDFAGATLRLAAGDAPGASVTVDLDVRLQSPQSPWAKLLLAPASPPGPVPDTLGRLSRDATASVYVPGGGPLVGLLDRIVSTSAFSSLDSAKVHAASEELRGVLGHGVACAHLIDLDEARAELGRARRAPEKDAKKTAAALERAFDSHVVCGVQGPIKAADRLARKVLDAAPKTPGETNSLRPAAGLGLPGGSFVLESIEHPPAGKTAPGRHDKPAGSKTRHTLFVPDGETTWIVTGEDLPLTAAIAKKVLAQPKGPSFDAAPGTLLTGYVTSMLGAFEWDLMMHSMDGLEATLANPSSGRLGFVLAQHPEGSGGTLSLRLTSDVPTLKLLAKRALPVAFMAIGMIALSQMGK
jgi:hypothetical protein